MLLGLLIHCAIFLGLLPPASGIEDVDRTVEFSTDALIILLLLGIVIDGLRTLGRNAWLPLTPGLVLAGVFVGYLLGTIFPKLQAIGDLTSRGCQFGFPLAILVVFLLRFTQQQRENVRLVDDMKQAQEVQQVLIPEKLPQVPGLTIENEYRPAREVGGDFFQIVPHPTDGSVLDGSVLIVAGDVTGKGLQAGMLVALIVGAIRAEAAHSSDPLAVLDSLNQRFCERGHAHATCLALRIASDGSATLANAGHLPPYLNGKELPMEGALPLGMIAGAEFSVMHFQLGPGDRLMLLSDGIAEAQDKQGRLFGFERIHEMLQQPITAAALATAAQKFGQEDDISVLSVTRTAKREPVIA